jgi:hypothetical protein
MEGEVHDRHDSGLPSIFYLLIIFTMQRYTTTDLCLAAVVSLYYPLAGVKRRAPGFVFQCDDYIEVLTDQYHRGDLVVEPQTFYAQIEKLRATQEVHRIITW